MVFIFSCNNDEKYYGEWINDPSNSIVSEDIPSRYIITKDSIKLRYPYFEYWHSFPVKLSNDKVEFNGFKFNSRFIGDTLVFNKYIQLTNEIEKSELFFEDNYLEINLPQLSVEFKKSRRLSRHYNIRYGKRIDNGEYTLNLNDKYSNFEDLPRFIQAQRRRHDNYIKSMILFSDKDAKMVDLEKIFFWFQNTYTPRISFVNDISINYKKLEPFYNYETLDLRLFPLYEEDKYVNKIIGHKLPPLPSLEFFNDKESKRDIILLVKNSFYFNEKEINSSELEILTKNAIKNKNLIISLYDLESNYSKFLELNSIIKSTHKKKLDSMALSSKNKLYNDLSIQNKKVIKEQHYLKYIWNFSIPHYNSIIKQNKIFFGKKMDTIDYSNIKL